MRYLSLDVGQRSIGVAVGELIGQELTTFKAAKGKDFYQNPELVFGEIAELFSKEAADGLVVGLPVNDAGRLSQEAKKISDFGKKLSTKIGKEVIFVNETLTSFMAEDILESLGYSIAEAKKREHQLSAKLILDQFLEENARL